MSAARIVCVGYGCGEAEGVRILLQHFNPRCVPQWSDWEVEKKCRDVMRTHSENGWGWMLKNEAADCDPTLFERLFRHDDEPPHFDPLATSTASLPSAATGAVSLPTSPSEASGKHGDRGNADASGEEGVPPIAKILTEIGLNAFDLWHDPTGETYATAKPAFTGGSRRTYMVRSEPFRLMLAHLGRLMTRKPIGGGGLADAITALRGHALYEGAERPAYVRTAAFSEATYIHLADPADTIIRIDKDGWRVDPSPPVRFVRPPDMGRLPMPESGGTIDDLWPLLNLPAPETRSLVAAWLASAVRGVGPFPILICSGNEGSAKSTTGDFLKRLTDPNTVPLGIPSGAKLPRDSEGLMIAARNAWTLIFDNVSRLTDELSDDLCRLSTGGGQAARRTLWTDDGQTSFNGRRPIIMNGIPDFATRADLLSRVILLTHRKIAETDRLDEEVLAATFQAAYPRLLGAVFDRVAAGLRTGPVELERLPRMARFARWAVQCESGMGEDPTFLSAYAEKINDARRQSLEKEPVVEPLVGFMTHRSEWVGPATELLTELSRLVADPKARAWPKAGHVLTGKLNRLATNIQEVYGLGLDTKHTAEDGKTRQVRVWHHEGESGGSRRLPGASSPATLLGEL